MRVQTEPFDLAAEIAALSTAQTGAVASFLGVVRDDGQGLVALSLEHYPGMTERALAHILARAKTRWPILDATIIHRVGRLALGEPIVLVAVAAVHRGEAFAACEFIMDYLKTEAPFWKQEHTESGARWVEARASDAAAAERWRA